ncbi:MAG: LamG domain-containing protein, partial [Candidatus Woesearchaeota archaeon]|nr:LamG domain-containing protein [Candidatus Woesearchaeota archaeon]
LTQFNVSANITDPSGVAENLKIIVNRTDGSFISEYPLIYDKDKKNHSAYFIVEDNDLTDAHNFIDVGASYSFTEGATLFYNSFDNGLSADYSEGNENAAQSGAELVKGRFFKGAFIESSEDCISYETYKNFDIKKGTIEFWIKPNWGGTGTPTHTLFYEGTENNNIAIIQLADSIYFIMKKSGYSFWRKIKILDWKAGEWHFIAATWDSNTNNAELYIDGSNEEAETSGIFKVPTELSDYFFIGCGLNKQYPANAVFDQFMISNKAKTKEEIINDMSHKRDYYIDFYLEDKANPSNKGYEQKKLLFSINFTDMPKE